MLPLGMLIGGGVGLCIGYYKGRWLSGLGAGVIVGALLGYIAWEVLFGMVRYTAKSKTSEVPGNLQRMYMGAKYYFTEHGKQLPPSAGPTPPLGFCCQSGGKCAPAASHWEHDTWVALGFEVRDTHRYSYQFINDGNTKFTVRANGDLDCDGHYSTFEMHAHVNENGKLVGDGRILRTRDRE